MTAQKPDNEREAFSRFLQVFGDTGIEEKILLTGTETEEGLTLKLKTESFLEGVTPDNFEHPELQIGFDKSRTSSLVYKERNLAISEFYRACEFLLEDLKLREKESHRRGLFAVTADSLEKYLQRGKVKTYFFKVYPMCVKFAPNLPTFEALEQADAPKIIELLKEEQQKNELGGTLRLSGIGFFKNIQWKDKDTRTYAFDPVDTYETGNYHSMQFREDLERYAALSRKQ